MELPDQPDNLKPNPSGTKLIWHIWIPSDVLLFVYDGPDCHSESILDYTEFWSWFPLLHKPNPRFNGV